MPQLAKRNGICEHCRTPIIKGVSMLATNSFDPDPKAPWLHQDCAEEQEAAIEAKYTGKPTTKEALQLASMEKLVRTPSQPAPLEEYDEPGPYDEPVYVRIEEAAARANMSVSTMHKVIREGYAKAHKKGGLTFVQLPQKPQS